MLRANRSLRLFPLLLASSLVAAAACSSGGTSHDDGASGPDAAVDVDGSLGAGNGADGSASAVPFTADAPQVYVAKVKNVLVGLPPTDAELQAVIKDPTQLKTLIDGWMTLPQYAGKMQRFFQLAFQQTQVALVDFADQAYPRQADINGSTAPLLVQNATDSFARTVMQLVTQGAPLTQALTTHSFMMTPALMEFYAFLDAYQVNDDGTVTDRFRKANPKLNLSVEAALGPIPIAQTLDPTNANYMHWYDADVTAAGTASGTDCAQDPIVYPATAIGLHFLLYGAIDGHTSPSGAKCTQYGGSATAAQLTADDFSTWKLVTVRPPNAGETPTAFYDLPTLRSASELVLTVPRVGFFSTPAFFANWQTNTSNQMRVTMNQTLIVATGSSVDGTDPTQAPGTPGLDTAHATDPACVVCHQTLDPLRSIFSANYSWNYHDQDDPTLIAQKGYFAFRDVAKPVSSMDDLATTLATHPLFGSAWVQKLSYWANSQACDPTDPEFQRVVGVFGAANYSWNALVRELLSSPLTTHASPTTTTAGANGSEVVAVSRRDHLCAALNNRLGFTDVCGLLATTKASLKTVIPEIVAGLPSDGYGRGAVAPVLPNDPTLFYRAGMENICEAVAALVIDTPAASQVPDVKQWASAQPDAAIADFVSLVMALPASDPRAAPASALLSSHFASAVQSGAAKRAALESTFVVACLAPSAISIGL